MDPEHERPPSEPIAPVEIPPDALSPETVSALIESFVLREGTDYGSEEALHTTKIEQIRRQLKGGQIKIAFDPETESVTIVTRHQWEQMTKAPAKGR